VLFRESGCLYILTNSYEEPIKIFKFSVLVITQSCDTNECEDILCNSGPAGFQLELVDKDSGENLFSNGTFNKEDLELINISESEAEYRSIDENDYNIIRISTFKSVDHSMKISNTEIFSISIDAEGVTEDCCFFTRVNEFEIEGADLEFI